MGKQLDNLRVQPGDSLLTVLGRLSENNHGLCVVVNSEDSIVGTITDGDCRRALLRNEGALDTQASEIMNTSFVVVDESFSRDQITSLMRSNSIQQIPIVDEFNRLKDVVSIRSIQNRAIVRPNSVVILAGGKGTRLRPLTKNIPKPMLQLGGKPMLQRLIEQLVVSNFTDIYLSVNYLGHVIEDHFGDGSSFGCNISYLKEEEELGTGGPLRLLPTDNKNPVLVMNGDLVTNLDFGAFVDFHNANGHDLTTAISSYTVQIPFGVVEVSQQQTVKSIQEKPSRTFPINAGLYVIDPRTFSYISDDGFFPITNLIEILIDEGKTVGAFPIHETWDDVGLLDQYFAAKVKVED